MPLPFSEPVLCGSAKGGSVSRWCPWTVFWAVRVGSATVAHSSGPAKSPVEWLNGNVSIDLVTLWALLCCKFYQRQRVRPLLSKPHARHQTDEPQYPPIPHISSLANRKTSEFATGTKGCCCNYVSGRICSECDNDSVLRRQSEGPNACLMVSTSGSMFVLVLLLSTRHELVCYQDRPFRQKGLPPELRLTRARLAIAGSGR